MTDGVRLVLTDGGHEFVEGAIPPLLPQQSARAAAMEVGRRLDDAGLGCVRALQFVIVAHGDGVRRADVSHSLSADA